MDDLLVLWDVDGTLLNAGGVGGDLYEMVFLQLFGRPLEAHVPMAGRTDRAIILDTLQTAGISEPRRYVDPFIEGLRTHASSVRETVALRGYALPGAAAALTALAAVSRARATRRAPDTPGALGVPAALGTAYARGDSGTSERVYQSVLTGNIRTVAEVKLSALGLREALDLCIGAYGDDHEVRAELVQVARRRAAAVHGRLPTDFEGGATVVVGDTPLDVEAALATGARAVGVATGRYSAAELARCRGECGASRPHRHRDGSGVASGPPGIHGHGLGHDRAGADLADRRGIRCHGIRDRAPRYHGVRCGEIRVSHEVSPPRRCGLSQPESAAWARHGIASGRNGNAGQATCMRSNPIKFSGSLAT